VARAREEKMGFLYTYENTPSSALMAPTQVGARRDLVIFIIKTLDYRSGNKNRQLFFFFFIFEVLFSPCSPFRHLQFARLPKSLLCLRGAHLLFYMAGTQNILHDSRTGLSTWPVHRTYYMTRAQDNFYIAPNN